MTMVMGAMTMVMGATTATATAISPAILLVAKRGVAILYSFQRQLLATATAVSDSDGVSAPLGGPSEAPGPDGAPTGCHPVAQKCQQLPLNDRWGVQMKHRTPAGPQQVPNLLRQF